MRTQKRTLIVSNRLPVTITEHNDTLSFKSSEGGLATGLGSIYREKENLWIGWPGAFVENDKKLKVVSDLEPQNLLPVFLSNKEITEFYEGFSNETLWPLFHYFPSYALYNPQHWDTYKTVNKKYAEIILNTAREDDIIWIHDYQLMLLPELLRKKRPKLTIGYFQHIPFPSYEIFRLLPWRKELLNGLLGADLIGFHTYDDVQHFISAANRIAGYTGMANSVNVDMRTVAVDALPIGIDYEKFRTLTKDPVTLKSEQKIRLIADDTKVLLSIDRLDYSKGIIHRLRAFELLLEQHPELLGKITFIHLTVPSRDQVKKYMQLKEGMDMIVSEINGRYRTFNWQPIHHFYRSLPANMISALYKVADVAIVTPMRDGMNLVSKEYVASKTDQRGVLVLSEMAGASRELSEALIVNPNDVWDVAEKIYQALHMPEAEQKTRMAQMQQTISKFNIFNWVDNFMSKLEEVKQQQQSLNTYFLNNNIKQQIRQKYRDSEKRLILLDYDGTLVPFHKEVNQAKPDAELLEILERISSDKQNKLVIISGRDYHTLDTWLGNLHVDLIAEHGAWYKDYNKTWQNKSDLTKDWMGEIRHIMEVYAGRTPGTFIEDKSFSLAWHYRKAEEGLGNLRMQELVADSKHIVADMGLQILLGDKVVEIKSMAVNKGKAARRWLRKDSYQFVMAIGDDHTDEDTFNAMPDDAFTIKVGKNISAATYYLNSYKDVRDMLKEMYTTGNNTPKPRTEDLLQ